MKATASMAGINVQPLQYWASCFKAVGHPQFPSNRVYPNGCEDIVDSSLTLGGQEAQDLVAFKALCAEETIEPQVSRVENNLIICYCSEICCFVFLLACTGQLESKPLGKWGIQVCVAVGFLSSLVWDRVQKNQKGGVVIGYHLWEIDKWYEDWSFWVHCQSGIGQKFLVLLKSRIGLQNCS